MDIDHGSDRIVGYGNSFNCNYGSLDKSEHYMGLLTRINNWQQKKKADLDPRSYCKKCGHYHLSMLGKRCTDINCRCKNKG